MKAFFLIISSLFFFNSYSLAADVVCGCEDDTCKDVEINFVPANPGIYLNVKFNEGSKVLEGFAVITSDKDSSKVIYKLGNFVLVNENGQYSMPASGRICK